MGLSEEKRKELLAKKKYYRKHPEEAKREYLKKDDGYVPKATEPIRK